MTIFPYRTTPAPALPIATPPHWATDAPPAASASPRLWDQAFLSPGPRGREVVNLGPQHRASLLQPPLGLGPCFRLLYLLVPSPVLVLVVLSEADHTDLSDYPADLRPHQSVTLALPILQSSKAISSRKSPRLPLIQQLLSSWNYSRSVTDILI